VRGGEVTIVFLARFGSLRESEIVGEVVPIIFLPVFRSLLVSVCVEETGVVVWITAFGLGEDMTAAKGGDGSLVIV